MILCNHLFLSQYLLFTAFEWKELRKFLLLLSLSLTNEVTSLPFHLRRKNIQKRRATQECDHQKEKKERKERKKERKRERGEYKMKKETYKSGGNDPFTMMGAEEKMYVQNVEVGLRHAFVRKVFALLTVQLLITFGIVLAFATSVSLHRSGVPATGGRCGSPLAYPSSCSLESAAQGLRCAIRTISSRSSSTLWRSVSSLASAHPRTALLKSSAPLESRQASRSCSVFLQCKRRLMSQARDSTSMRSECFDSLRNHLVVLPSAHARNGQHLQWPWRARLFGLHRIRYATHCRWKASRVPVWSGRLRGCMPEHLP